MGSRDYKLGYEFNAKTGSFQRAVGQMTSSLDKLKKQVNLLGFSAALDIAQKVMSSTRAIANLTMECVKLAAAGEGVKMAFDKIGNQALLNDLRTATRGAVDDLSLMKAAVQANNFKIPLETLATLLQFAGNRALETGEDFDYLVESMVKGLGRKSVLILDNLGLSVAEINEEVKKTGDFFTGASAVIKREMEKSGVVLDTTTTKIAQMGVAVTNLKLAWGQFINQSEVVANAMANITTRFETFADKDLNFMEKMTFSPKEYREWKRQKDEIEKFFPKLSNMGMKWQSPFSVPPAEAQETKEVIEKEIDLLKQLKEFNSFSSLGYKGIGYGGKEGASTDKLKFNAPAWKKTTPGIQAYGGMSQETINAILENTAIEEGAEKLMGLVGELNNSFTNLFYNVGNGWRGMIDAMINSFKMLVAQIASKAVIFAILSALSGGTSNIGKIAGEITGGGFKKFLGFAAGTNFAPGGMSLVGERGPELVNLPRGSKVIPNNRLGGGGDMLITKLRGSEIDIILKRHYKGIEVVT